MESDAGGFYFMALWHGSSTANLFANYPSFAVSDKTRGLGDSCVRLLSAFPVRIWTKLFCKLPFFRYYPLVHSHKILTKQQGWLRGVSSVGNPRQALTGFNSGSLAK